MLRYGTDKPDLRFGLAISDVSDLFAQGGPAFLKAAVAEGGVVRGLALPGAAGYSRRQVEALGEVTKETGAGGLATLTLAAAGMGGTLGRQGPPALGTRLAERLGAATGDLLLFAWGPAPTVAAGPGGGGGGRGPGGGWGA